MGLIVRTKLNSKLNTASKKFNGVVFDVKMGLHIFFEEVTKELAGFVNCRRFTLFFNLPASEPFTKLLII